MGVSAQKIMRPKYDRGEFVLMSSFEAVRAIIMEPIGAAKMGGRTFTRNPMDTAEPSFGIPIVKVVK
jgi:hypothetical protein